MKRLVRIALLGTILPVVLFAQAEQVPVNHPVYDFLSRMQVNGDVMHFSDAVLPLERKEVTEYLRSLGSSRERMSATEQALLDRFTDEFVAEADGTQKPVVLFGSQPFVDALGDSFNDREKFLYRWMNDDRTSTFFMEFIGTSEFRSIFQGGKQAGVWLGQLGGQFRGTVGGVIGYGLRATNGTTAGSRTAALSNAALRLNANYADWQTNFFDITEAYVSGSWSWGHLTLGKQSLLYGNSFGSRSLVSTNAPPFDAIRLNVHVGDFRFAFVHGFLRAEQDTLIGQRPFFENKYLALHRAEADILDVVRIGVYEAVIYSQRQVDPAYLNPINFYKSAEHASGDRDNPMLGFDITTLAFRGTQFRGSWTIDDVDYSKWGTDWWGNKFIWQAGVSNHSLMTNTELTVEYTRIEPWTLSHTFRNNEYTNKSVSIGLELPPNSDEWFLRLRHWVGSSIILQGSYQFRRHGADVVDEEGKIIRRHGGNINAHYVWGDDDLLAPFLGGVRETQHILTAGLRFEPYRNLVMDATYRLHVLESLGITRTEHLASFLIEVIY